MYLAKKEIIEIKIISLGVVGQKNLKFTICGWPIIRASVGFADLLPEVP